MKKIVLSSCVLAASLFAASDAEILGLYSNAPKDIKISIVKREPIADGFEAVTIKFQKGELNQENIIFTKGDFMFPDIINLKTKKSEKKELEQKMLQAKLKDVYSKEDPKNIIKLGDDSKKPTLIIFTDPDCPFCKQEMSKIKDRLKDNNVEIILTSVHGDPGFAKSYKIYEEARVAKSEDEKLAILNKYYTMQGKVEGVDAKNVKELRDLARKYQEIGITGVPMIIEKNTLK